MKWLGPFNGKEGCRCGRSSIAQGPEWVVMSMSYIWKVVNHQVIGDWESAYLTVDLIYNTLGVNLSSSDLSHHLSP